MVSFSRFAFLSIVNIAKEAVFLKGLLGNLVRPAQFCLGFFRMPMVTSTEQDVIPLLVSACL